MRILLYNNILSIYITITSLICISLVTPLEAFSLETAKGEFITLDEAIKKALDFSPKLNATKSSLYAANGSKKQALYLPNPEFSIEAANFAGQGSYKGFKSAEVTYGISQQIEIGGKRSARQEEATHQYNIINHEYQATQLDVIQDVTIAYIEAIASKEAVKIAEEQLKVSGDVQDIVYQRVNSAAEPLALISTAEVAYSTSLIALNKAEQSHKTANEKLAALMGMSNKIFNLDSKVFFSYPAPISLPNTNIKLNDSPDIAMHNDEIKRLKAILNMEKANAIPDPTLNIGLRSFRETRSKAFTVGVTLPIPILNSNKGNISKAKYDIVSAEHNKNTAENNLKTELSRSYEELLIAYKESRILKDKILPAANKAFLLARANYQSGKFPYLAVLDAQRTLFDVQGQYNNALKDYHCRYAEVKRLIGKRLPLHKENGASHVE